jgi:NADPH:quinone reductase-like Zn-dependent oxidoreductase
MKKYIIKPGEKGIDALHVREMKTRQLKPDEVCVRMHAVSLNYRDLINVNRGVKQELIPLSDGAGEVEETGSDVTDLNAGDRVVGLFFPLWQSGDIDAAKFAAARGGTPTDGMLARYVYGSANSFLKFPDHLSYEEASTLPCAGLTAWNALVVQGELKSGQTIVIMGTGGVALFALQLSKNIGARTILISSTDEKLQKARRMGADELINYTNTPNWEGAVLEKTSQIGADLILELGGGGTLARSLESAKINGRISLVGVLTGFDGQVNPLPILRKSLAVKGIYVGSGDMQKQFHAALEQNTIHPVIDRTFNFDQAKEAYQYLQSGRHFGKIVIRLD